MNFKVRLKNKTFWLTIIPAILLAIQAIVGVFGIDIDLGELGNKLLTVVNSVFVVLSILGIVTDPTTAGVSDSTKAMSYNKPKVSKK